MTVDFYYMAPSAPCRAVRLAARALGVELNLKPTNLLKGEQLTPEFLKMNPTHTIPTINDDGFCLWESRAILTYLADKYGTEDTLSLYPKDDVQKRAVVDQRLFFDQALYQRFGEIYYPMLNDGVRKDMEKQRKLEESLGVLDKFLGDSRYAAGDNLTLADHALVSTVSTIDAAGALELGKYPNVKRWYEDCKKNMDGYQGLNGQGATIFRVWASYKKFSWAIRRPFRSICGH
ncbi:hypothetical protein ONE63_009886 [Megalurothrips usitatus]|uniref:Uncharacterized protein n=1 Tax=Megalurothrips usitatus TaxID=439358 RepID=A0AAV7XKD2_9NEOP|nr:hypothetical protein ONE63_009886 [Megalurothrips usitatus]